VRMLVDHPGWFLSAPGRIERPFRWRHRTRVINCRREGAGFEATADVVHPPDAVGAVAAQKLVTVFDPDTLPEPFRSVAPIRECGQIQRLRSPDLWSALLPPVLQQHMRTSDGVRRYRRLCHAYGEEVRTTSRTAPLPPRPETVLGFDDAAFARIGLTPAMADRLRSVASTYLEHAELWLTLTPGRLLYVLQEVRHVGPWMAATATADLTNDFSVYPRPLFATPGIWDQLSQISDSRPTPNDFDRAWQRMTREQKSTLAALSIDWKTRHPLRRDEAAITMSAAQRG
jgi:DNA-3-methyladenine glycosylase II